MRQDTQIPPERPGAQSKFDTKSNNQNYNDTAFFFLYLLLVRGDLLYFKPGVTGRWTFPASAGR